MYYLAPDSCAFALGHIVSLLKVVQEGPAIESKLGHLLEALYKHFDVFHNTTDAQHEGMHISV